MLTQGGVATLKIEVCDRLTVLNKHKNLVHTSYFIYMKNDKSIKTFYKFDFEVVIAMYLLSNQIVYTMSENFSKALKLFINNLSGPIF